MKGAVLKEVYSVGAPAESSYVSQPRSCFSCASRNNRRKEGTNIILQAMNFNIPKGLRVKGAYISPTGSGLVFQKFLDDMVKKRAQKVHPIG